MPELRIHWRATFLYRLKIPSRTPAFDDVTYFHVVAYHGYDDILDLLLSLGLVSDINIRTNKGNYTALLLAISNRHHKAISFLFPRRNRAYAGHAGSGARTY